MSLTTMCNMDNVTSHNLQWLKKWQNVSLLLKHVLITESFNASSAKTISCDIWLNIYVYVFIYILPLIKSGSLVEI